jgi:hypothetical protein
MRWRTEQKGVPTALTAGLHAPGLCPNLWTCGGESCQLVQCISPHSLPRSFQRSASILWTQIKPLIFSRWIAAPSFAGPAKPEFQRIPSTLPLPTRTGAFFCRSSTPGCAGR